MVRSGANKVKKKENDLNKKTEEKPIKGSIVPS